MLIFAVAIVFFAFGVAFSEAYNRRMWDKYLDGMRNGVSMKEWKEESKRIAHHAGRKGM